MRAGAIRKRDGAPLRTSMECNHCHSKILADDSFCSWCGQEVTQIVVRDRPIRLYVDQQKPTIQSAKIITNRGPIPLTFQCVSHPTWLDVVIGPNDIAEPGEQLSISLRLDPNDLDTLFKDDELVFQPSPAGGETSGFKDIKIKIQVWPAPEVIVLPLVVYAGRPSAKSVLEIDVPAEMSIETLAFDPPYIALDPTTPVEITQLGKSALPIHLNLPEQIEFQRQIVHYEMLLEDLDEPLVGEFEMIVKKSATFSVLEQAGSELTHQIIPSLEEEVSLVITNTGDEVLEIERILVMSLTAQTKVILRPEKERFSIEPNKLATITLKAVAELGTPNDNYFFKVDFQSNDPVQAHRYVNLNIKVVDEEYQGFLAFDFGTTDSAVARFEMSEMKPLSVYLEGQGDPKIYSNIFFTGHNKQRVPPYMWKIGATAKQLGPRRREHFVKAIKTKIGRPYEVEIAFKDEDEPVLFKLGPEKIAELIVRDLLWLTYLSLRSKPVRIILSVPTRFTKRRRSLIQKAFEDAARSLSLNLVRVETIDESLAAGLFYIMLRGPNDEMVNRKENYTMMILDFGGGTTDVTVFNVQQEIKEVTRVKEVEIIGAWGDATLGGEGITTEIAELLATRFLDREINPNLDAIHIKQLEDEAENVKLAVSELLKLRQLEEGEFEAALDEPNSTLRSYLEHINVGHLEEAKLRDAIRQYQTSRQLDVSSIDFTGKVIKASEDEVIAAYEGKLKRLRNELDIMMVKIGAKQKGVPDEVEDPKVDVLLLAGQSSRFPTVKEIFQDLAKNNQIDFVRNQDGELMLKECVSMGALYWTLNKGKIKGRNRVWDRIGRTTFVDGVGLQFEELIPWGSVYPHTSEEFVNSETERNRVVLEVYENLRMDNTPRRESAKRFEIVVDEPLEEAYFCRLCIEADGELKAECYVQDEWLEMEKTR